MNECSPLNRSFAVHACYLFLEEFADVSTSAFQCGGKKAVGDAEYLWMEVKVFNLKEEKGES